MQIVGLKGDRVRLVPPERERHFDNALAWMNNPEITARLAHNLGVSRLQEEEFFDRIERSRDPEMNWAIHAEDDRHIGFIGLHFINWKDRSTIGGLVIGDRSAWGRGYATDAVRTRSRFVFEQLGLHRLEGHTFNPAMRRVYEKCGYQHEGTARQKVWRDGRWHDVDYYALLAADHFGQP